MVLLSIFFQPKCDLSVSPNLPHLLFHLPPSHTEVVGLCHSLPLSLDFEILRVTVVLSSLLSLTSYLEERTSIISCFFGHFPRPSWQKQLIDLRNPGLAHSTFLTHWPLFQWLFYHWFSYNHFTLWKPQILGIGSDLSAEYKDINQSVWPPWSKGLGYVLKRLVQKLSYLSALPNKTLQWHFPWRPEMSCPEHTYSSFLSNVCDERKFSTVKTFILTALISSHFS